VEIKLNVEGKIKKIVEERVKKTEKAFWRELEKLRKRIVELELKNMDIKKIKINGNRKNL
jgi:uncharacterized protein YegJ (DUF2314 family)